MADREWDDYSRAIDPPIDAAARVRARLDRVLAERAGGAHAEPVTAERMPRAAAVILFAKSTALSLTLAIGGLGALHVGARVIAGPPATPPIVAEATPPALERSPSGSTSAPLRVPEPPAAMPQPLSTAPPEPTPQPPSASEGKAIRSTHAPTSAPPTAVDLLGQETALIDRARAALRAGDRRGALAALEEHARRFASGSFADERDAFIAMVRCAEPGAARSAIADAFAGTRPRSPHLARVRASCSDSTTDPSRPSE
jgi:hypothetical protein